LILNYCYFFINKTLFAICSVESSSTPDADGGPGNSTTVFAVLIQITIVGFPALSCYRAIVSFISRVFRSICESVQDTYVFHTLRSLPRSKCPLLFLGRIYAWLISPVSTRRWRDLDTHTGCALYFSSHNERRPKNNNPKVRRWLWNACSTFQQDFFPLKSPPALAPGTQRDDTRMTIFYSCAHRTLYTKETGV
jgi:hypothetical protein